MPGVLSSSHSLADIEAFVRDMRAFGATKVQVGGIAVEFDGAPERAPVLPAEPPEQALEHIKAELKKKTEELLYGSSD